MLRVLTYRFFYPNEIYQQSYQHNVDNSVNNIKIRIEYNQ